MIADSERRLNALVAYPYMSPQVLRVIQAAAGSMRFVLDSGAFTAWKAGRTIALDDYCRFIESLPVAPWRYFTLDVVGDPHGSTKNYQVMLARGFKPVPIFTRGEDPSVLDDYYKTSDVVGIGGLVQTPDNKAFVNGIMRHIGTRRVHWLGFTNLTFIKQYRPYMCDSSNWMASARFAVLKLYVGNGQHIKTTKQDFKHRPSPSVLAAVRRYGFDPALLAIDKNWVGHYPPSRKLAAASAIAESLDIQRNCGTLNFLATTTPGYLTIMVDEHRKLMKTEERAKEMADA